MDFERLYAAAQSAPRAAARAIRDDLTDSATPVFSFELRTALRNCGHIEPGDINDYIRRGRGYGGLARCLKMTRQQMLAELALADPFPTLAETAGDDEYVVCNAIDPDPQARTARLLLESDPHAVLEGMLIAAFAVGARRGVIAVADEYPAVIERLATALGQMRACGLLGGSILDSAFSAEIEVRPVKRALVLDDETALLAVLEGRPALPRLRAGRLELFGKPALVDGPEAFARLSGVLDGHPNGETRVITIAGEAVHQYTVEVQLGTTLRTLVTEVAGGVAGAGPLKAVQFGGPAGAFFGPDSLDTPVSRDNAGSGTLRLFAAGSCAVEMARDAAAYLREQSCGKCVFCREGTYQMSVVLTDIVEGRGRPADVGLLVELGEAMKTGAICELGARAADPVLSSIARVRGEFDAHISDRRCLARAE